MKKIVLAFALTLAFGNAVWSQLSIIPQPLHVQEKAGKFIVNPSTQIYTDGNNAALRRLADSLAGQVQRYTGSKPAVKSGGAIPVKNAFILSLKNMPDTLGDEGYQLDVNNNLVHLKALKPAGLFYGLETIYQMMPAGKKPMASLTLPAVSILDKPRYEWRGMLLDVGRYFYPVEFVKKYIDYLALHKMNRFHWHLTDDQGWRVEIKKYPRLTEIGAWRDQTMIGHLRDQPRRFDGKRSGGFYTQDEIREVVAYAKDRYITVIPEIEMPGHSTAALAAYPELSCTGGPFKVAETWGIKEDVYCAGNEKTFQFLQDVLTEVIPLFPSTIIHIGGDECPKTRWKVCPKCQARIKAEGLKDEHELQSYFIRRMEKFLLTKNRSIIGWDEILEGGLAPNATVMSWTGVHGGIEAARQHHNVIMTPYQYLYLDLYQGNPGTEPMANSGYTTMQKVYNYDPTPAELSPEEAKYIRGGQGAIWAEYIATPDYVEYMAMPRMSAVAEILWSDPVNKNWEDFKRRMQMQYARYDELGVNYSHTNYEVQQFVQPDTLYKRAIVLLKTDSYQPEIRYTTDGSEPGLSSPLYTSPFPAGNKTVIKAANFQQGKQVGRTTVNTIDLKF